MTVDEEAAGWASGDVLVDSAPLRITATPDGGLHLAHAFYGRFALDRDATRIDCAPFHREPWLWQRFLVAQALPAAAALRGLHPMHAGAVALDGRAVLVLGSSGSGKTSTGLALLRRAARFVADDVAALDLDGDRPRVWPGSALVSLDPAAARALGAGRWQRLGTLEGEDRLVVPDVAPDPLPVALVVLLTREADRSEIAVQRDGVEWIRALLGSHFAPWLAEWQRAQEAWLSACLALADRCDAIWVRTPLDGSPERVAEAIAAELGPA